MKGLARLFDSVLRFLNGGKVASLGFFGWVSANFLTFFIGFQLVVWILSAIFTVLLAFFGTEIISGIFDLTGISSFVNTSLSTLVNLPEKLDAVIPSSSLSNVGFSGSVSDAFSDFSLIPFVNFFVSFWFGVFALKINLSIFRMSRFKTGTGGVGSLLSGWNKWYI